MRTLPSSLTNAINSVNQEPTLTVTIQDLATRWNVLASGLADGRFACITNASGNLQCAAVSQGPNPNSLTVWTVSNPTAPSSWTGTRATIASNCAASAGCALSQSSSQTTVYYQRTSDQAICYRSSTDGGTTWSAESALTTTTPLAIGNLCYGITHNGTYLWAVFASYDTAACALFRWTGTAWSNEGPTTPTWGQMRGLSCALSGATTHFACAVQTRAYQTGLALGVFSYSGGTYSTISTVCPLDTPSLGLAYAPPSLILATDNNYYLPATLTDNGSLSGTAANRTTIYRSTDGTTFTPLADSAQSFPYGCQARIIAGQVALIGAPATLITLAPPATSDVSADVLALTIHDETSKPSSISLTLANDSGQYNNLATLRSDATITIAIGYGGQTATTHTALVDTIHHAANAIDQTIVITARDHLRDLTRATSRMLAYTNQTVGQILTAIAQQARATLGPLPTTPQFSTTIPCFLIKPGETWEAAIERLAHIYLFDHWCDSTNTIRIWDRSPTDPNTWSYTTDQLLGLTYGTNAGQPNIIRVTGISSSGQAVFADAIDTTDLLTYGREKVSILVDKMCDTSAKCSLKARQEIRDAQASTTSAAITIPLNPAHELMDVITITDTAQGLTNARLRIHAISWHIETETGTWDMILTCLQP